MFKRPLKMGDSWQITRRSFVEWQEHLSGDSWVHSPPSLRLISASLQSKNYVSVLDLTHRLVLSTRSSWGKFCRQALVRRLLAKLLLEQACR